MALFSFLSKDEVRMPTKGKIIPAKDFSRLMESKRILEKAQNEALDFREKVAIECETLRDQAEAAGFQAGMQKWNDQILFLENEIVKIRKEMENAIVPLALTAAKKIVGREIELNPETVVDIVANALKAVSQHKRIALYVNRSEFEIIEKERPRLKKIFEHLETLTINVRDDVSAGGCIIETEAGIINAQLENQWKALENAFYTLMRSQK